MIDDVDEVVVRDRIGVERCTQSVERRGHGTHGALDLFPATVGDQTLMLEGLASLRRRSCVRPFVGSRRPRLGPDRAEHERRRDHDTGHHQQHREHARAAHDPAGRALP